MICCLIMISMQCCCRYYLHPRQEDWLYYTSADTVSWQDTTPDRMTGRWVTISQEAARVSSVSPCQLSGRRRVHITRHMPAGGRGDTLVYTFIITYSGQFPAQGLHFWEGPPSHTSTTFTKNLSWHSMFQHFQLISNHYKEQLSLIQLVYPLYTSMGKGIHCWRNIGQKIHLGLGTSLSADEMMVCVRMLTWLINSIIFIWPCAVVAMPHTTLWSLDNYTSWSLFQIRYSLQWPHWTPQPTVDDLKILTRD